MSEAEAIKALAKAIGSLRDWQDLIAGILAVLAAVAAISQSRFYEFRRIRRRENAARATLPLVLSAVCSWATETGLSQKRLLTPDGVDQKERLTIKPPQPLTEQIEALERMIESTDDQAVVDRISLIIANMQVLTARIGGLADRGLTVTRDNIAGHIVEAAVIYAQAESMFKYARRQAESVPEIVGWDRAVVGLYAMHIYEGSAWGVFESLQRSAAYRPHIESDDGST